MGRAVFETLRCSSRRSRCSRSISLLRAALSARDGTLDARAGFAADARRARRRGARASYARPVRAARRRASMCPPISRTASSCRDISSERAACDRERPPRAISSLLRRGPAGARARGARRRRARRRVSSAARCAISRSAAARRFRPRDHRAARGRRCGARARPGFTVAPTGLAHGTVTRHRGRPAVRDDDAARGRRDRRAPRDGAVRARFPRRRAAARLHHQRALARPRRAASTTIAAGSTISPRVACASSATRASASARTICASCASSAFPRASAQGDLDAEGFAAAIAEREGLAILSRERVRAELLKLLAAPRASEVVAEGERCRHSGRAARRESPTRRGCPAGAIEAARGETPDAMLRLAALAVGSRRTPSACASGCGCRMRNTRGWTRSRERWRRCTARRRRPRSGICACCCSSAADKARATHHARRMSTPASRAAEARFASAYRFVSDTPQPQLPFSGADVVARGVGPGQRVGVVLKTLQALWIWAGFPKEPETLARLLDEALNS